jgi:hypothetical protein
MNERRRFPMRRHMLLLVLLTGALFALPRSLSACPSCADAVPLSNDGPEDDELRIGRAYNQSIYLMVAMPYLLLGGVGFLVYRGLRQRAQLASADALKRGSAPCLSPSPDGVS